MARDLFVVVDASGVGLGAEGAPMIIGGVIVELLVVVVKFVVTTAGVVITAVGIGGGVLQM